MKLCLLLTISLAACALALSLPIENNSADSPVRTVVIPYSPYSTERIKNSKGRTQNVYVPLEMSLVPRVDLKEGQIALGSEKGRPLNIAEGAYPVYYMAGNANGKFQNKMIYLLE